MALSAAFIDAHINHWEAQLQSPFFPHRKHWPSRLFHHAPIENAVAILQDGCLRSRADEHNCHPVDVAAPGVIDTRAHAHGRVRLYFRPKTPTQYSIEGIRKEGECRYGESTHTPLIVMFCLDARRVLALPDIEFSDRNMQVYGASVGNDEVAFSQVPFAKVFHEGSIGDDRSIIEHRCAEVMPSSPLELADVLQAIFFRSSAERETLLHLLGNQATKWEPICHVSDALKVFQKEYSFVDHLELSTEGLVFRLNPRRDRASVHMRATITRMTEEVILDFEQISQAAKSPSGGNWIVRQKIDQGRYTVRVWLEGHRAFEGLMTLEDELV